jgi:hypothetical protein
MVIVDYFLHLKLQEKWVLKIQSSIEIKATAANIWSFLVKPEHISKWCPVETVRYTGEQQTGLNTSFYFEELAIGRLLKFNFIVTEWVLNESVAFILTSGDFVKGYEQRYTIEPTEIGNRFTCYEDVRMPYGILGRVGGLFRRSISIGRLDKMLVKLKTLAEA